MTEVFASTVDVLCVPFEHPAPAVTVVFVSTVDVLILRFDDLSFSATEVFASKVDVLFVPVDYPVSEVIEASAPTMGE